MSHRIPCETPSTFLLEWALRPDTKLRTRIPRFVFRSGLLLLALSSLGLGAAEAVVPGQVSYQGLLLDSGGSPVTASVDIDVALFDDLLAGTLIWSESHTGVAAVLDGVYATDLGSMTPLSPIVLQSGNVFLEITINAETLPPPAAPRRPLRDPGGDVE